MLRRLSKQGPYFVVLLIAGFLYFRATRIDFAAPGERIGPDVWPKAILVLAMLTCAYEIVKGVFFRPGGRELGGVLDSVIEGAPGADVAPDDSARGAFRGRLAIGIALTIAYAALIDKLGFLVCTAAFLAAFTWVGGYRRAGVVLALSVGGSLAFMFMFMKVVYVSLPLGVGPFADISVLTMRLMGIR